MKDSSRVIKNTIILYIKVIVSSVIGFFTTRFVLENLGVEDYGINNVVSSVVAMLSFMSISMTTSTLRFNAYYLGKNDLNKQIEVFNSSILVHVILGIFIILILETIGIFFLEKILKIPINRMFVAKCIFHFVTFSMFITILSVPLDAINNAHENMFIFSVISLIETLLRFIIAIILYYVRYDKLLFYSILISFVPFVIFVLKYVIYSRLYKEIRLILKLPSKSLLNEMFLFTFWNMFGAFSNTCKGQGISMILNVFYGVTLNAAFGISNQVNGIISTITVSMQKSLNPLIMKNEGAGNHSRAIDLAFTQFK